MKVDKTPLLVLLLLAAVAAAQFARHYPELPETIAVHFAADGHANGWSQKDTFVLTYGAVEAIILLVGVALAFLGNRIRADFLNIPNHSYWLAAERRRDTLRYTWSRVIWLETATLAFLIAIAEIIFRANRSDGPPTLTSDFFVVLVAFVVAIIWQSVSMMLRFRVPDARPGDPTTHSP